MMDAKELIDNLLSLKNKLYRLGRKLLSSREDAEDAVQDVLIKLWQKSEKIDFNKNLEALAITSMKNLCIDKLRTKKNNLLDSNLNLIEFEENFIDKLSPDKLFENNDSYEKIRLILNNLPENQRMIFHLRDIEGYSYEEISEILKMKHDTVKVNLSRARKKLRELLIKNYEFEF